MDNVLERLKTIINDNLKQNDLTIKNIILFGSRARNENNKFSDYDLLIIINKTIDIKDKIRIVEEIIKLAAKEDIDLDLIIKSEEEVEYYKNFIGTVTREALKEGINI